MSVDPHNDLELRNNIFEPQKSYNLETIRNILEPNRDILPAQNNIY